MISAIRVCERCGAKIPADAPEGGCPGCLLEGGLGLLHDEALVAHARDNGVRPGEINGEDDSDSLALSDGRFGIYEIERHPDGGFYELGRGGMGVTYRAVDTSLQRKVALKIIKAGIATRSSNARERFMREARLTAALRQENIATVYQFGICEDTGQYFYAMELIEGETLEERVRRTGPLSVRTTIDIAQQITAALAVAEKHGLLHRDLKPGNLMLVSRNGETVRDVSNAFDGGDKSSTPGRVRSPERDEKLTVKIIDFGLAKALDAPVDATSLTRGGFVGTPEFASPEQFEHSSLDVRSDIYSLGATLWFALTGHTPFAGHKVEEVHEAQQSDVLPIEQLKAARVPSGLRSLLVSMLALQPARRPGTHELAARLQRCSPEAHHALRINVALTSAAILALGVSVFFIFLTLRTRKPVSNVPIPEKSLAVLPFENLSGNKDNAYFADGVQDEILTRLASLADLKVISRTSAMQYKTGTARDLNRIGHELGVAHVVEGSVQRAANSVRVNAHLIDVSTNQELWAQTYDRKLTDIFGVESEIAKAIAESLQARLTGREEQALAVKPTDIPEAYDAYLRGLALDARSHSSMASYFPDVVWKAISFYEQAVQLDPNFSIAWARLSRLNALSYFNRDDPHGNPVARRDAAKRALENAQNLEPSSAETLLALGYYQYWVLHDYGAAKTTLQRVSKIEPGNSEVPHGLALITRREGHWNESIAYLEQALAFDPRNVELVSDTAETYGMVRRFPTALKLYDRALDIIPSDLDIMAAKGSIYQAQGNLREAARFLLQVNWQTPSENTLGIKITQLRLEQNYPEAIRLLQARQAGYHFPSDNNKAFNQVELAFMQGLAGDAAGARVTAEQARNTLEQLCTREPNNAYYVKTLSQAYAVLAEKDSALNAAERAIRLLPRSQDAIYGPRLYENLALIQTIFHDNTSAISTLTQVLQTPYGNGAYGQVPITSALLRLDPLWSPLRNDPAFQKLCEEKQP